MIWKAAHFCLSETPFPKGDFPSSFAGIALHDTRSIRADLGKGGTITLFCRKMMRCPTCDKELRALQVETMIGNPDFNEWCRNGYCSHECYERRDPSRAPVELKPRPTKIAEAAGAAQVTPSFSARDPISYSLAKICLLAVPVYLGIAAVGNFAGLHRYPGVAFFYFVVLGAFIMIAGLASGIAALIAIRKHGADGLLWKSVIGILLIGGFVYLGVSGIVKSKAEQGPTGQPATTPRVGD